MTCIVGIETPSGVILGADSAGTAGTFQTLRADEKVFTTSGGYVMGFTSSFRMGQLLRYKFALALPDMTEDVDTFMCTAFVDEVRTVLKQGGFARKESEAESGGTFLVGVRGKLYCIQGDYQVERCIAEYNAIGCGAELALGSLYSTAQLPPYERVDLALRAAEAYSAGVRAPFRVVTERCVSAICRCNM